MKKILFFILFLICCHTSKAEKISESLLKARYSKTEAMIPMRDGISLYTAIYTPKGMSANDKRPILMQRTPYGCGHYGPEHFASRGELENFYRHNYIIVFQDVRGRYMSEGKFENLRERPEDTYDTIEWLLENIPNHNGKVGITGCSYLGYYATVAATAGHPALKAVCTQAPILDWYMGDDAHHNGVLMLMDTYFFGRSFYRDCPNPTTSMPAVKNAVDCPIYDFFLNKKTFGNITATFPEPLDFWNKLAEHPDYDDFWKSLTPAPYLKDIKPAVLVVGGSYDTDDCYGALNTFRRLKEQSPGTELYFLYGPWYHGSWRNTGYFRNEIEYPFFCHYLENGPLNLAKATILPSGLSRENSPAYVKAEGNGKITVREFSTWPAKEVSRYKFFLHFDKTLSADKPDYKVSFSSYVSNPDNPVPYYEKGGTDRDRKYMIGNQKFVSERQDVLSFSTPPLSDTLKVLGHVGVGLYASTSKGDADFVVKIIDEAPDGYQMLVRWDVMRARYRKGFEKPVPMIPGKIEKISLNMNDVAHYFMPGHRLVMHIQSSLFPAIDLNPGNFMENIYKASEKDYVGYRVRVYHDKSHRSYLDLGILNGR